MKITRLPKLTTQSQEGQRIPLETNTAKKSTINEANLRANAWSPSGKMVSDGQEWILQNNQRFGDWVNRRYNEYRLRKGNEIDCFAKEDQKELFRYQKFVKTYMDTVSPYRGILLYHGLGSGKTRSSIEIAQEYANEGKMCLFISKAKLIYNFAKELAKWGWTWQGKRFTETDYKQFIAQSTGRPKAGRAFLKKWGVGYAAYNAPNKLTQLKEYADEDGVLRDMVIIIDEVHNLVQNLYNGINQGNAATKKRLEEYYNLLLMTDNCRFVTLSGTPIINRPTELSILFNILRGPVPSTPEERPPVLYELFPIEQEKFDEAFVDWGTGEGKNLDIFKRRTQGLVSYYSGARGNVFPTMVDEEGNPTDEPVRVDIPMGKTQASWYELARKPEREARSKKGKKTSGVTVVPSSAGQVSQQDVQSQVQEEVEEVLNKGTSYRVKSRMAGLFGFDNYLGGLRLQEKFRDLFDLLNTPREDNITEEDIESGAYSTALSLGNLEDYSSKMAYVLRKMDNTPPERDGGILIYSNYRTAEGISLMAEALKANGWVDFEDDPGLDPRWDGRRFAVLGSDADKNSEIIGLYNSEDNLFDAEEGDPYTGAGRNIKVLLGTEVISEGVDLFNIRQVHILEPHWNMVRVKQTIGRARRICSHKRLPQELWDFTVWIYLATPNPDVPTPDLLTTDQIIFAVAERKEDLNSDFLQAMKEAAVDCRLNANHNTNSGKDGGPVKCMEIPRPASAGEDEIIYAYWPDYNQDFGEQQAAGPTKLEVIETVKKIAPYTSAVFPPRRFPELWDIRKRGAKTIAKPKYFIEVNAEGRPASQTIKYEGKSARSYQFYDRIAYESQGQAVPSGNLVQFKNKEGKTEIRFLME